jgi:hypothetical protein
MIGIRIEIIGIGIIGIKNEIGIIWSGNWIIQIVMIGIWTIWI